MPDGSLIIDRLLPQFDALTRRHLVIPADTATTFRAATHVDLVRIAQDDPAMRWLFMLRGLADRIARQFGRAQAAPEVALARLVDMPRSGEWVRLGEDPGREFAFGAVGRFWGPQVDFHPGDAGDFPTRTAPGTARIAAELSVRPYGAGRSLLSYEVRTAAADDASRRAFLRYWRLVGPFVGWIMSRFLAGVSDAAVRTAR